MHGATCRWLSPSPMKSAGQSAGARPQLLARRRQDGTVCSQASRKGYGPGALPKGPVPAPWTLLLKGLVLADAALTNRGRRVQLAATLAPAPVRATPASGAGRPRRCAGVLPRRLLLRRGAPIRLPAEREHPIRSRQPAGSTVAPVQVTSPEPVAFARPNAPAPSRLPAACTSASKSTSNPRALSSAACTCTAPSVRDTSSTRQQKKPYPEQPLREKKKLEPKWLVYDSLEKSRHKRQLPSRAHEWLVRSVLRLSSS